MPINLDATCPHCLDLVRAHCRLVDGQLLYEPCRENLLRQSDMPPEWREMFAAQLACELCARGIESHFARWYPQVKVLDTAVGQSALVPFLAWLGCPVES